MSSDITDKILEYVDKTEIFVQAELPLYIAEYLAWHFWSYVFLAVMFLILSIILYTILSVSVYLAKKYDEGWYPIAILSGIIGTIVLCFGVPINTYYALKVKIAPRVYIVDQIMDRTKK